MKLATPLFTLCLILLMLVTLSLCQAESAKTNVANLCSHNPGILIINPSSGIIHQPGSTTTFDGVNVRYETVASMLCVEGERGWSAYSGCGRVVTNLPRSHLKPYSQRQQIMFSELIATNAVKIGNEPFRELLGWHYRVKVNTMYGDPDLPTVQTNDYLFLANSNFPVLLRRGSVGVWQTNMDVLSLQLNCLVSPELFAYPTNLRPTRPFQFPAVPFEMELRETRASAKWGWSSVTTNILSSDGKAVTIHSVSLSQEPNGKQHSKTWTHTENFRQGVLFCNYPMVPLIGATCAKWGKT